MASLINIYIPGNFEASTDKESIYTASNAHNTARQAGMTAVSWAMRQGLYRGGMNTPIAVYDDYDDCLRTDSGRHNNNVILRTEKGVEIEFINAVIKVEKKNSIVSSALVSGKGKVKELIQEEDYTVTVSGSLINDENGKFPSEKLRWLNSLLSEAGTVNVASVYLYNFDIEKLALEKAEFDQGMIKHFNALPFKLEFKSDKDYDFLIVE
jgi:hypothetical protein